MCARPLAAMVAAADFTAPPPARARVLAAPSRGARGAGRALAVLAAALAATQPASAQQEMTSWTAAVAGTANATGMVSGNSTSIYATITSFAYPTGVAEVITTTSGSSFTALVVDRGNNVLRGQTLSLVTTPLNAGTTLLDYAPSTIALTHGNGTAGYMDGTGADVLTKVMFNQPFGISTCPTGYTSGTVNPDYGARYQIWVTDTGNHAIRGVSWTPGVALTTTPPSSNRKVTTLVGGAFGNADTASPTWSMTRSQATTKVTFGTLTGIASTGGFAFVCDSFFHRIRVVVTQNNSDIPIPRISSMSFSSSSINSASKTYTYTITNTPGPAASATMSAYPAALSPYPARGPYPNGAMGVYVQAGATFAVAGGGATLALSGPASTNGGGSDALFNAPTGIAWDGNRTANTTFVWTLYVAAAAAAAAAA